MQKVIIKDTLTPLDGIECDIVKVLCGSRYHLKFPTIIINEKEVSEICLHSTNLQFVKEKEIKQQYNNAHYQDDYEYYLTIKDKSQHEILDLLKSKCPKSFKNNNLCNSLIAKDLYRKF